MIYHLYQRTITSKGKKIKAWYYWFYDEQGKQVRKSCGVAGKPCTVKRDAQAFIEKLPSKIETSTKVTFNQFCNGFYDENSPFMIKQHNRGIDLKSNTIYGRKHYLSIFLDKFGDMYVDEVTGLDIDNWLLSLPYSGSVRNHILVVVEEIEKELYSYHLITSLPLLERVKRVNQKQKGVLFIDEIHQLFPDDYDSIVDIWKLTCNGETDYEAYMFAVLIFTILSTGMRSAEIRALQWNQFVNRDAILINAQMDSDDKRTNILKKGTNENKKWRVVVLPERTIKLINSLKVIYPYQTEFVFERHGEPFTTYYLLDHFKLVLGKNGIDHKSRNITVHSLRFTYNTIMRPEIDGDDLRLMLGHVSETMTEYYDKSQAIQHLPELMLNKDKLDTIWK